MLLGIGSLKLGALGASVGWGIYQAMQIIGGQAVGFLSGEWREVHGKPRNQMCAAIAVLILVPVLFTILKEGQLRRGTLRRSEENAEANPD